MIPESVIQILYSSEPCFLKVTSKYSVHLSHDSWKYHPNTLFIWAMIPESILPNTLLISVFMPENIIPIHVYLSHDSLKYTINLSHDILKYHPNTVFIWAMIPESILPNILFVWVMIPESIIEIHCSSEPWFLNIPKYSVDLSHDSWKYSIHLSCDALLCSSELWCLKVLSKYSVPLNHNSLFIPSEQSDISNEFRINLCAKNIWR